LNGHYIRQASLKKLEKMLLPVTSKIAAPTDREGRDILKKKLARIILLIRERIKTLIEAGEIIKPFFDGITYNEKIINYTSDRKSEAQPVINGAIKSLSNIKNFNAAGIEISLRKLSEELEIGFRKTAEFIRIAVWGDLISPPLFETMEILGRQTTLQRLKSFKSILNHYLNTTYPQ